MKISRMERLMPNGIPRYVRIYDDPRTLDRYTVIFTKKRINDQFMCLALSLNGFGFYQHLFSDFAPYDSSFMTRPVSIGRKHKTLGLRISFESLNKNIKNIIVNEYKELWKIN